MGLTGTHCSCISWVGASTSKIVVALAAFCQVTLCPCTVQTVIPGWTTSSSKDSWPGSFNCSRVAQLTAHNCSVGEVPVVITHSPPLAKEKDLNTTFQQSIPSHQPYRAFCNCVIWCDIYRNIDSKEIMYKHVNQLPVRCDVEYTFMMPGYFGSTTQFRLQWVSTHLCAYKMYLSLVQEKQYRCSPPWVQADY